MDAARVARRRRSGLELGPELRARCRRPPPRAGQPREVALPRLLALAELVGRVREPAQVERDRRTCSAAGAAASSARSTRRAASRASSEAPWYGMPASASTASKSASRACVRHRIAISSSGHPARRIRSTRCSASASGVANGRTSGSGPAGCDGTKRLLRAAELRHEPVGELEHLRRRAVVLLQPDHRGAGSAPARRAGSPASRR